MRQPPFILSLFPWHSPASFTVKSHLKNNHLPDNKNYCDGF